MVKRHPKARQPAAGKPRKQPVAQTPPSRGNEKPTFSFEHVDNGHGGPWGKLTNPESCQQVIRLLGEMSKLTWSEIRSQQTGPAHKRRPRNHSQPIDSLCKAAQDRIRGLRLDETFDDEIFRFRDGGTGRLWGFLQSGTFYVVWWDPGHDVCPTERTHT